MLWSDNCRYRFGENATTGLVHNHTEGLAVSCQEVVRELSLALGFRGSQMLCEAGIVSHCFNVCILALEQSLTRTKPKA